MLALRSTVEHWRCKADHYAAECARIKDTWQSVAVQAELKAIKFQTLADCYKLEIERLERIIAGQQPATGGGFVPMETDDDAEEPTDDAPAFADRLDEIFGNGLSMEEIEARHASHRRHQIEELEAERALILKELHGTP